MCSAYDSADNVEKAKVSGMTGFLFKPVKAENLKRILQKYHLY
jgi:response regulator of citrate/malate metabolism